MLNELRLANIIYCTEYILSNNLEGDFVECGVWKGGSVAASITSFIKLNQKRTFHLFIETGIN